MLKLRIVSILLLTATLTVSSANTAVAAPDPVQWNAFEGDPYEGTFCTVPYVFDPQPGPVGDIVGAVQVIVVESANVGCRDAWIFFWWFPPGVYQALCIAIQFCPTGTDEQTSFVLSEAQECDSRESDICWVQGQLACRMMPIYCPQHCPPSTPPNNYYCNLFHEAMEKVFGQSVESESFASAECAGQVEVQHDTHGNSWHCNGDCVGNVVIQVSPQANTASCEGTCAGNIIIQVGSGDMLFACKPPNQEIVELARYAAERP